MHVGVLLSRVRVEEKLIFAELNERGVAWSRIEDPELVMHLNSPCRRRRSRSLVNPSFIACPPTVATRLVMHSVPTAETPFSKPARAIPT